LLRSPHERFFAIPGYPIALSEDQLLIVGRNVPIIESAAAMELSHV
jgi:hypothetical protein